MIENKAMGMRIRKQRELMGYTREVFAEKLGVSPKFCSDIELGHKGISIETLCKISHILKLSTDYILFGKESAVTSDMLWQLVSSCPESKRPFLTEIIKNFVIAFDEK